MTSRDFAHAVTRRGRTAWAKAHHKPAPTMLLHTMRLCPTLPTPLSPRPSSRKGRQPSVTGLRLVAILQKLAYHGAKRDRQHRLVQQMISARSRFTQPFGRSVSADEEGGNWCAESATYALDHI